MLKGKSTVWDAMQYVGRVIAWATEAARQNVELARFNHQDVDSEGGMGLWQSFQAAFPKDAAPVDYDFVIGVYSQTYREVSKAFDKALPVQEVAS